MENPTGSWSYTGQFSGSALGGFLLGLKAIFGNAQGIADKLVSGWQIPWIGVRLVETSAKTGLACRCLTGALGPDLSRCIVE